MNLKKNGKVFTSKSVGTGPSSYEKRIYRAAVAQKLRYTAVDLVKLSEGECLLISRKFAVVLYVKWRTTQTVCVVCSPSIGATFKNTHTQYCYLPLPCTVLCISEFSLSLFFFPRSQYSHLIWVGRSGNRILVVVRFSAPVQTGPGTHSASCTMGIPSFSRGQSGRGCEGKKLREMR